MSSKTIFATIVTLVMLVFWGFMVQGNAIHAYRVAAAFWGLQ